MTQPGLAAEDIAEEELRAFAKERRSAVLLQASATVVGAFLPLTAVIFYPAVSIFFIPDRLRVPPHVAWHCRWALVAWNPATANQCATMRYHREHIDAQTRPGVQKRSAVLVLSGADLGRRTSPTRGANRP